MNPAGEGTKAAAHVVATVPGGGQAAVLVRLTRHAPEALPEPFADAEGYVAMRRSEADEFYDSITPPDDRRRRQTGHASGARRHALVEADATTSTSTCGSASATRIRCARRIGEAPATSRGSTWSTTTSSRCPTSGSTRGTRLGISPSIASPLAMVDPDFAKSQLDLMLSQLYLHPSGQMPAYEWNFGDVNPPVHAFATLFLHSDRAAVR